MRSVRRKHDRRQQRQAYVLVKRQQSHVRKSSHDQSHRVRVARTGVALVVALAAAPMALREDFNQIKFIR
jgi:hypothetical protein